MQLRFLVCIHSLLWLENVFTPVRWVVLLYKFRKGPPPCSLSSLRKGLSNPHLHGDWVSLLWFGAGVLQVWWGVTCLGSSTWHMPSAFLFSLPFGVAGWYVPLTPCYCIDIGCPVLMCHPLSSPQYVGWLVLWSILLLAPVLCHVFSWGCSQWNYYFLVFTRYINACFFSIL